MTGPARGVRGKAVTAQPGALGRGLHFHAAPGDMISRGFSYSLASRRRYR
jgi:hypothetical protein